MQNKSFTILIILFTLVFFDCNKLTEPESTTGSIKGKIMTFIGDTLLSGVTVYTTPSTSVVTTNLNGEYIIDNVPEGDYIVYALKPAYKKDSVSIRVIKNKTSIADLKLKHESTQLSSELILYYPFNGNANDESGNNYHGIVNGAVLSNDRFGRANSAFYFSGSNTWIQTNNLPQISTNFTYCAWIKIDNNNLADRNYNFGCYGKENSGVASWDFAYHPIKSSFEIFNRPADGWARTYSLDYNWHFVVITFGNNSKNLFVDGIFIDSKNTSLPIPILTSNNFRIGAHINDGSQQFRGYIDDIRIYNKILTNNEILELYYEGGYNPQNYTETIVFTYKLNNQTDIWKINPDGTGLLNLINWPSSNERNPVLSPDGKKLAFISNKSGKYQIWISNSDGSNPQQITFNEEVHSGPEWSPDGQWLFYAVSITTINTDIYKIKADGSQRTAIKNGPTYEYSPAIDPIYGRYLVFKYDEGAWGPTALSKRLDMFTGQEITLIDCSKPDKYGAHSLRFSPTGEKIAFERDIGSGFPTYGGPCNIYIMNSDGTNWIKLTNLSGSGQLYRHPTWSPDGKKIVFSYDYPLDKFHDYLFIINLESMQTTKLNINQGGEAYEPYWGKIMSN